jgi:hypothetical protein
MTFASKMLIFWIAVIGIGIFFRFFPHSKITRFFQTWYGPTPKENELKSRFLLRWSWYAIKWFLAIGLVFIICLFSGFYFSKDPFEYMYFSLFFAFGLPMLMGIVLLGGVLCFIKAFFLKGLKKDKIFEFTQNDFVKS